MSTFEFLIEAVEENNRMNDASWEDWGHVSSCSIEDAYGELDDDYSEEFK